VDKVKTKHVASKRLNSKAQAQNLTPHKRSFKNQDKTSIKESIFSNLMNFMHDKLKISKIVELLKDKTAVKVKGGKLQLAPDLILHALKKNSMQVITYDYTRFKPNMIFALCWDLIKQFIGLKYGHHRTKYRFMTTDQLKLLSKDIGETIAMEWIDFLREVETWQDKGLAEHFAAEFPAILHDMGKEVVIIHKYSNHLLIYKFGAIKLKVKTIRNFGKEEVEEFLNFLNQKVQNLKFLQSCSPNTLFKISKGYPLLLFETIYKLAENPHISEKALYNHINSIINFLKSNR